MPSYQNTKTPGFETTFITRNELSDEGLKTLQERLANVVTQYKGQIVLTEDWGKKKLAYPIQKETRGHYTYMVYTGQGEIVGEIERNLRLNDQVLRFLSVNISNNFEAEAFGKMRAEHHAAAKRREEEREARREERNAERRGYDTGYSNYSHDSHSHSHDDADDVIVGGGAAAAGTEE